MATVRTFALALTLLFVWQGEAFAQRSSRTPATSTTRAANARSAKQNAAMLRVMTRGSLELSRTATIGWHTLPPPGGNEAPIARIARRNFGDAARLVLTDFDRLPLTLATATQLNRVLTRDLVDDAVRGRPDYHGRDPRPFYRWLASAEAKRLAHTDPVALASRIHFEISHLDAFPDGNGRTARLMADLALLKAGHAPASYTSMKDYFDRGGPRNQRTPAQRLQYFREAVARGDRAAGLSPDNR